MGSPKTPTEIAAWAENKAKPADTPAYKRLTNAERVLILKLHEDGKTQVEIAQALGRAQSTISDVLDAFTDTTDIAKRYLDANALRMAENVVENGQPRDHNVALAGRGVLKGNDPAAIKVAIAIALPGMPTFAPNSSAISGDLHKLSGDLGSDNGGYVVNHQSS